MEVSKKNKVETEISIWDNYKAPDKTEEPQQEYPGLTAEKVNEIVNEVFSAGRLSGGLYSQIQQRDKRTFNTINAKDLEEERRFKAEKEKALFFGKSNYIDKPISKEDLEEERKALAEVPFSSRLSSYNRNVITTHGSLEQINAFEKAIRDTLVQMKNKNK
jgi:hypothetical protein